MNTVCTDAVEKFVRRFGGANDAKKFYDLASLLDASGLDITYAKMKEDSGRSDGYKGMKITISNMVSFIFLPGTQKSNVIYLDRDTNKQMKVKNITFAECIEFVKRDALRVDIERDVSFPDVSDEGMGFDLFG